MSSFEFAGPQLTPALQELSTKEQMKIMLKDMGNRSYSSAKNFAVVAAIFSSSECFIEGVSYFSCFFSICRLLPQDPDSDLHKRPRSTHTPNLCLDLAIVILVNSIVPRMISTMEPLPDALQEAYWLPREASRPRHLDVQDSLPSRQPSITG